MNTLSRWLGPAALAAGLGFGAIAPAQVQAQDDLTRVLVDVADVVFRSGDPYYRNGNYGSNDRLTMGRDRYGRPVYYRQAPNYNSNDRYAPPYGNAYGYDRNGPNSRNAKCDHHGKCTIVYYDARYDRDRHHRDNRRWDDRRWDDRR